MIPLAEVQKSLGVKIKQKDLLKKALTHRSIAKSKADHYECLEFLGDRVVSLIVAAKLLEAFPEESEGEISRRHAGLVNQGVMAEIASELDLGKYIQIAASEGAGNVKNPSILGDVLEAVVATIYLDQGMEAASEFVTSQWGKRIYENSEAPKDAKTQLQEVIQAMHGIVPEYRIISKKGPDHNPLFEVAVTVPGMPEIHAYGSSRRSAEQEAAQKTLKMMNKL